MARNVEAIVIEILGKQAFQIAVLQAQVEDLIEKDKIREDKMKGDKGEKK